MGTERIILSWDSEISFKNIYSENLETVTNFGIAIAAEVEALQISLQSFLDGLV